MSRVAINSLRRSQMTRCAKSGNAAGALFNDGSRASNQFGGYLDPEFPGGLEIDDKVKPLCLGVRYVARTGSS